MKFLDFKKGSEMQILVCVGNGGVGKTTTAAAAGVLAAQKGLKVLVLTIDPSQRLASTLGIAGQKDIVKVPEQNFSGELYASVVDHKKTFDDFVLRAAAKSESAAKLFKNKLYQQLSTNLSGSQDFTALEKLYSVYESKKFDLIILDTPPAKHAMDFLNAPEKLAVLFNDSVAKWFRESDKKTPGGWVRNIVNSGTKQVLNVLESVTGSELIGQLADFFQNIQQWQGNLEERIINVQKMLTSPGTHFCLVTSFDRAKMIESEFFLRELKKGGYYLQSVIVNRSYPEWFKAEESSAEPKGSPQLFDLYQQEKKYYKEMGLIHEDFARKISPQAEVLRLPEVPDPISDLKGLERMAQMMEQEEKRA